MDEMDWQPVRIAPMSNLDPRHGAIGDYAPDYQTMIGKIIRVRPLKHSTCPLMCQQYEIHADDRPLVSLEPGYNAIRFCQDQILAD
jgi:hypothetical protein